MNILVRTFFWAVRDDLKAERFLGFVPPRKQGWAKTRKEIRVRFGISASYLDSLAETNDDRNVTFHNHLHVIDWLHSYVEKPEERDQVTLLVMNLLLGAKKA